MAVFDFDGFGLDSIQVKFKCDKCNNEVESDELSIPLPDITAESAKDSVSTDYEEIYCANCGKEFGISISNSFAGGFIDISEIDDDDLIEIKENHEELSAFYDEQLEAILYDHHSLENFKKEMLKIRELNELELGENGLNETLKRHLYSGCITCLETYLSDKLINAIYVDENLFKEFVKTYKGFKDRRFHLNEFFDIEKKIKKIVERELLDIIYHNLPKVKGIYEKTFKIEFPEIVNVTKAVSIRHDLVHRNGKTKEGNSINITKAIVTDVLNKVETLVFELDKKIISRNKKSISEEIEF